MNKQKVKIEIDTYLCLWTERQRPHSLPVLGSTVVVEVYETVAMKVVLGLADPGCVIKLRKSDSKMIVRERKK